MGSPNASGCGSPELLICATTDPQDRMMVVAGCSMDTGDESTIIVCDIRSFLLGGGIGKASAPMIQES